MPSVCLAFCLFTNRACLLTHFSFSSFFPTLFLFFLFVKRFMKIFKWNWYEETIFLPVEFSRKNRKDELEDRANRFRDNWTWTARAGWKLVKNYRERGKAAFISSLSVLLLRESFLYFIFFWDSLFWNSKEAFYYVFFFIKCNQIHIRVFLWKVETT